MKVNALSFLAAQADHHVKEMHRVVSTGIGMVLANMGETRIEISQEAVAEFERQYDVMTEKTSSGAIIYRLVRKALADDETNNLPV